MQSLRLLIEYFWRDLLWFCFQAGSDIWFDCCEDTTEFIDNVIAGVISSDSDSETEINAKFVPCIGRGLSIPPLHDVHMPRVAFLDSQVNCLVYQFRLDVIVWQTVIPFINISWTALDQCYVCHSLPFTTVEQC